MKKQIIFVLTLFSLIIISTVVGMLYISLKFTTIDFNKDIIASNEKTMKELLELSKKEGKNIIINTNKKVVSQTRNSINTLIKKNYKKINQSMITQNKSFIKMLSERVYNEVNNLRLEMNYFLRDPNFMYQKEDYSRVKIKRLIKLNSLIKGAVLYDEAVDLIFEEGKIKKDFNELEIEKIIKKENFYLSKLDNNNNANMAFSIFDDKDNYKGFLLIRINLKQVLANTIADIEVGELKNILIINNNNIIIADKDNKNINSKFKVLNYDKNKEFQVLENKKVKYLFYRKTISDMYFFVVLKTYPQPNILSQDSLNMMTSRTINKGFNEFNTKLRKRMDKNVVKTTSKAEKKIQRFNEEVYSLAAIAFFICIIISVFLGIFFANYITAPVKALSKAATKIGAGKLDYKIDKSFLKRKDEIGKLAYEVNDMKEKLQSRISQIRTLERKKAQAERLSMMGQMVSGIVHEIKNPLASISGFAQLIEEIAIDDVVRRHCKTIIDETDRLNKLALDLLNFAKIKALEFKRVNVKLIVEDVLEKLKPELNRKGIELSLRLPETLPSIQGDKDKLTQLFINIVSNGIEAIKDRNGRMEITGERKFDYVELRFKDNGAGIPKDIKQKLFLPFVSGKKNGTGLGLALAKKVVSDHEGNIAINEELETGAEFIISIPIIPGNEE